MIDLPANSCRIACTKIQNFEEEEHCASTVLVDHNFGSDMKIIGSDMILFGSDLILLGSNFKFQELLVMLVAILINFSVKNQVLQVSFKLVAGDLMLVSSYEFADIIFFESLVISEAISYYGAQAFTLQFRCEKSITTLSLQNR